MKIPNLIKVNFEYILKNCRQYIVSDINNFEISKPSILNYNLSFKTTPTNTPSATQFKPQVSTTGVQDFIKLLKNTCECLEFKGNLQNLQEYIDNMVYYFDVVSNIKFLYIIKINKFQYILLKDINTIGCAKDNCKIGYFVVEPDNLKILEMPQLKLQHIKEKLLK